MNSFKKVILLTCVAGSASSMHAGRWQDFKDSCSGLYAACANSISSNSSALSTKACDTYASCVNSVHTNASNIKEATIKVTAPVVNPAVSATKSVANGIANTARFTFEHPLLIGSAALAATVAYLAYCKNSATPTAKDQEIITQAKKITDHMFDLDAEEFDKIAYWRFHVTQDEQVWPTAADIMANQDVVYPALIEKFGNGSVNSVQEQIAFIDTLDKQIDASKNKIAPSLLKLKKMLAKYYIMPSTRSAVDRQTNNYVTELIREYTGPNRTFITLTTDQVEAINDKIMSKVSRSFINPVKIIRRTALGNEAAAIEQYWNAYQLSQRLEALKACIGNKRKLLTGGLAAR